MIAWAQSARRHLEHFAKGYRFAERLPLEQLTGVLEVPGRLIVIASMQSHWIRSSIDCRFFAMASALPCQGCGGNANIGSVRTDIYGRPS
jgi:hypothetical protein